MKPLSLNLSTMTKIAQDKHSATFKHSNGHEIKILLSALPAIQRDQVKKLPLQKVKLEGGGDVNPTTPKPTGDTKKAPEQTSDPYDQTLSNGWDNLKKAFTGQTKKAHGGDVKMYADSEEPVAQDDSAPTKDDTMTQDPNPGDGGLKDAELEKEVQDAQVQPQASASGMVREQQERPAIAQPEVKPVENMANPNGTVNVPQVVANEAKNLQDKANIAATAGVEQAALNTGYQKQLAVQADQDVQDKTEMEKHVKEFDDWKKANNFNERAYLDNMSTGKKISTAIGLFLGGFGQGLVGGNNPAMDFLQSRIADNIAGQKERYEQEKNIFGAYMKEYDNKVIASNLTKVTLNKMLANELNNTANNLATPMAKFMANQATTSLAKESNDILNTTVANRAIQRSGGTQIKGGAPGFQAPASNQVRPNNPAKANPLSNIPGFDKKSSTGGQAGDAAKAAAQLSKLEPNEKGELVRKDNFHPEDHLLTETADKDFDTGVIGKDPRILPYKDQITHELQVARAADKAIDALNEHFPKLVKNLQNGDTAENTSGYLRRKAEHTSALPYVGNAVSGTANITTDTQKNRDFDVHANAIKGPMISMMVKNGLSPTQAEEMFGSLITEVGDTPKMNATKLETWKQKIRDMVPTFFSEKAGFVRKRR